MWRKNFFKKILDTVWQYGIIVLWKREKGKKFLPEQMFGDPPNKCSLLEKVIYMDTKKYVLTEKEMEAIFKMGGIAKKYDMEVTFKEFIADETYFTNRELKEGE